MQTRQALLSLAQHLSIPAADTIAFGDSSNDLRMLRAAGTSVAMGNAAPEVRAACDYVTEPMIATAWQRFSIHMFCTEK